MLTLSFKLNKMGSNEEDIKEGLKYEIAYLTSLIKLHKQASNVVIANSRDVDRINKENVSSIPTTGKQTTNSACSTSHLTHGRTSTTSMLASAGRENQRTVRTVIGASQFKNVTSTKSTSLTNIHADRVQKQPANTLGFYPKTTQTPSRPVCLPNRVILSKHNSASKCTKKPAPSSPINVATNAALHNASISPMSSSTTKVQRLRLRRQSVEKPKSVNSKYKIVHVIKASQRSLVNRKTFVSQYKLVKKTQQHSLASPRLVVRRFSSHNHVAKSNPRIHTNFSQHQGGGVKNLKHHWRSTVPTENKQLLKNCRRRSWVSKYSLKHGSQKQASSERRTSLARNAGRSRFKFVNSSVSSVQGSQSKARAFNSHELFKTPLRGVLHGTSRYSWVSSAVRKLKQGSYQWRRLSVGSRSKVVNSSASASQTIARYVIRKCLYRIQKKAAKSPALLSSKRTRQYCIYFHRFGKCKRGDSCPHIHDPYKVAVCTRYLRGTCDVESCPFSHTVAPEKMPTCRYFLNGYCGKDECPYRHVNVSKNAKACPDFIRGHCPRGLECPMKHVLNCPDYEATGSCPAGTRCKLIHPGQRKHTSHGGLSHDNRAKKLNKQSTATSAAAAAMEEDEDDINAPFGLRRFPSYIALPATPNLSLSLTQTSTRRNDAAEELDDDEEIEVSRADLSFLD